MIAGGAEQNAHVLAATGDVDGLADYIDGHRDALEEERMVGPALSGVPLHAAVYQHQTETVAFLLTRGANVNARASVGHTHYTFQDDHSDAGRGRWSYHGLR
ncbi:MAG: hypothetical protein CMQ05_12195 [Gammaproteobacteria bacterium]|nr:hypothetical protein [Gammaproteobacteria bacterium]